MASIYQNLLDSHFIRSQITIKAFQKFFEVLSFLIFNLHKLAEQSGALFVFV